MNRTFSVGKRQALVPTDSPTRAKCLGQPCADGEVHCPRHFPTLYPDEAAQHRALADVIVINAPTLAEGLDKLRAALAEQLATAP